MQRGVPRGPVFSPPPRGRKKPVKSAKAFGGPRGECPACTSGDARLPCTCTVQDRCSSMNDAGHQCILGAGHSLRHVTAAGKHWR